VLEEYFSTAGGESQPGHEVLIRPVSAMIRVEMSQLNAAEHELVRCREIMASGEDWRGLAGVAVLAEAVVAAAEGRFQNAEAQSKRQLRFFDAIKYRSRRPRLSAITGELSTR